MCGTGNRPWTGPILELSPSVSYCWPLLSPIFAISGLCNRRPLLCPHSHLPVH